MLDEYISGYSGSDIISHLADFKYFQALSEKGRERFIHRVQEFISTKDFQGGQDLEQVTDHMKVMVSACAVQLTFGLHKFDLSHYHTIRIFPHTFYSHIREAYLKGGTTPGGTIFLSWEDFEEGYEKPDDRYNLGLHEMGHALKLDVIEGYDFDQRFASYLDNWEEIGKKEFEKIRQGFPSFLRQYAGTNMHEFFAVCVEHFFEVPVEFKRMLPDIYNHLCILLNQDPSNVLDDYRLEESFYQEVNENVRYIPVPKGIQKNYKYNAWHWSMTVLLAGPTLGLVVILILRKYTIIHGTLIGCLVLLAGTLGLLQWKRFKRSHALSRRMFVLYSYLGQGLCSVAALLLVNYWIRIYPSVTEVYHIENTYIDYSGITGKKAPDFVIELENAAYEEYPALRTFDSVTNQQVLGSDNVRLTFSRGLFGMKILTGYEFLRRETSSKRLSSSALQESSMPVSQPK